MSDERMTREHLAWRQEKERSMREEKVLKQGFARARGLVEDDESEFSDSENHA